MHALPNLEFSDLSIPHAFSNRTSQSAVDIDAVVTSITLVDCARSTPGYLFSFSSFSSFALPLLRANQLLFSFTAFACSARIRR